jgi:hypothetical protein
MSGAATGSQAEDRLSQETLGMRVPMDAQSALRSKQSQGGHITFLQNNAYLQS